jgi:hypothetical protein
MNLGVSARQGIKFTDPPRGRRDLVTAPREFERDSPSNARTGTRDPSKAIGRRSAIRHGNDLPFRRFCSSESVREKIELLGCFFGRHNRFFFATNGVSATESLRARRYKSSFCA